MYAKCYECSFSQYSHIYGIHNLSFKQTPCTITPQVLTLKKLGIDDLVHFDFMDRK